MVHNEFKACKSEGLPLWLICLNASFTNAERSLRTEMKRVKDRGSDGSVGGFLRHKFWFMWWISLGLKPVSVLLDAKNINLNPKLKLVYKHTVVEHSIFSGRTNWRYSHPCTCDRSQFDIVVLVNYYIFFNIVQTHSLVGLFFLFTLLICSLRLCLSFIVPCKRIERRTK